MLPTPFGSRNPDAVDPSDDPWQSNPVLRELAFYFDSGDTWGSVMIAWFAVADVLFAEGERIPDAWQYRPGACQSGIDPDDFEAANLLEGLHAGEWTADDLREAGDVLAAEAERLRADELDY